MATTAIFVISLSGSTDRRDRFAAQVPADIDWLFFDAHTELAEGLRYDPRRAQMIGGRSLANSELGCYSSHFSLWRQLLDDCKADRYIVFEDDVVVDWDFVRTFQSTADEIQAPLLRFFYAIPTPTRNLGGSFAGRCQVVEILGSAFGAAAYAIDKYAAGKLVHHLKEVLRPVDVAMDRSWEHKVRNLAVFPFPMFHPVGQSQIGHDERWNADRKPLWMKGIRASIRIQDSARRMLWYLRR